MHYMSCLGDIARTSVGLENCVSMACRAPLRDARVDAEVGPAAEPRVRGHELALLEPARKDGFTKLGRPNKKTSWHRKKSVYVALKWNASAGLLLALRELALVQEAGVVQHVEPVLEFPVAESHLRTIARKSDRNGNGFKAIQSHATSPCLFDTFRR